MRSHRFFILFTLLAGIFVGGVFQAAHAQQATPATLTITASTNPVAYGAGATLNWATTDGSSGTPSWCGLFGGQYGSNGITVNPSDSATTNGLTSPNWYQFGCYDNTYGVITTPWYEVDVQAPTVTAPTYQVNPYPTIPYGTRATISWSVTPGSAGVTWCKVYGGQYGTTGKTVSPMLSGSMQTNILYSTPNPGYSFGCNDAYYGYVPAVFTQANYSPPAETTVSASLSPANSIAYNGTQYFTATVTPGDAGIAWCGWSGGQFGTLYFVSNSNMNITNVNEPASYQFSCYDYYYGVVSTPWYTVDVNPPSQTYFYINATDNPVAYDTGTTLNWQVNPGDAGASSCTLFAQDGTVMAQGTSGATPTGNLTSSSYYTLGCMDNYYGFTLAPWYEVNVDPLVPPQVSLTADAASVQSGASTNLNWSATAGTYPLAWCGVQGGTYGAGTQENSTDSGSTGPLLTDTSYQFNCEDTDGNWSSTPWLTVGVNSSCPAGETGTPPNCTPIPCYSPGYSADICTCAPTYSGGTGAASCSCTSPAQGTPPSCTVPVPTISVSPNRVGNGETTVISWSASDATDCSLSGATASGPVSLASGVLSCNSLASCALNNQSVSSAITAPTTFTITCGAETASVNVGFLPSIKEI